MRHTGPAGAELAVRRKAAGLTQRQLAEAAGVGRTAVQYWEAASHIDPRGWAVERMAEALDWYPGTTVFGTDARVGWADSEARRDAETLWAEAQLAAFKKRDAARAARRRVVCGARTRKGTPCRMKSIPGKRRCKFHGGMSTGARTLEGIERIREAQHRRWARVRAQGAGSA